MSILYVTKHYVNSTIHLSWTPSSLALFIHPVLAGSLSSLRDPSQMLACFLLSGPHGPFLNPVTGPESSLCTTSPGAQPDLWHLNSTLKAEPDTSPSAWQLSLPSQVLTLMEAGTLDLSLTSMASAGEAPLGALLRIWGSL